MRGSPLLRAALMAAVLLALLVPLRSFTTAKAVPAAPRTADAPATETVHLQVISTTAPFTFSVSHLGQVIWRDEAPMSPVATEVRLPFPKEGIDLAVDVKWPSGGTAAVKLSVSRDGDQPMERTVWGDGAVNDVLTFP